MDGKSTSRKDVLEFVRKWGALMIAALRWALDLLERHHDGLGH